MIEFGISWGFFVFNFIWAIFQSECQESSGMLANFIISFEAFSVYWAIFEADLYFTLTFSIGYTVNASQFFSSKNEFATDAITNFFLCQTDPDIAVKRLAQCTQDIFLFLLQIRCYKSKLSKHFRTVDVIRKYQRYFYSFDPLRYYNRISHHYLFPYTRSQNKT